MLTMDTKEQIFYAKNGKPKSVLLDYKIYVEMLEDAKCVKLIRTLEKEPTMSEDDFKKKLKFI